MPKFVAMWYDILWFGGDEHCCFAALSEDVDQGSGFANLPRKGQHHRVELTDVLLVTYVLHESFALGAVGHLVE